MPPFGSDLSDPGSSTGTIKVAEFLKNSSLKGLCCVVSDHVACGAPDDAQFILVDSVSDEKIANVDVLRARAARSLPVLL